MIKCYCDRCGAELERQPLPAIYQNSMTGIPSEIHLCNECRISFRSWLDRKEIKAPVAPERAADPEGWKDNILGFF